MTSLLSHLTRAFTRQRPESGTLNAAMMLAGGVRAFKFRAQHRRLLGLEIFRRYVATEGEPDPMFHLSHRYYLSRSFNQRERVESVVSHYRFEDANHDAAYKEAVYRGGGLVLWSRDVDATTYAIKLAATTDLRHEGGISILLMCGEAVLCEMSYAWVEGGAVGLGGPMLPFITRNQSIARESPALARFRAAFPQNSPPYFCLAAMHGVAETHGFCRIAGIRHELQVAYEERYASGFNNSYCQLWKTFGGTERGRVAYEMPVPLATTPISDVTPKHRKRALERRARWAEIAGATRRALAPHVLARAAVPVHTTDDHERAVHP